VNKILRDWVNETIAALRDLMFQLPSSTVEGISFSGQMHGLVLLDANKKPLRRAILWNDTRSTKPCRTIEERVGEKRLYEITKNPSLEGMTLSKLLWVKENEPDVYKEAEVFLLPKDYVCASN